MFPTALYLPNLSTDLFESRCMQSVTGIVAQLVELLPDSYSDPSSLLTSGVAGVAGVVFTHFSCDHADLRHVLWFAPTFQKSTG